MGNSVSVSWLVGIIVGDGRVSQYYVRIYNSDVDIIHRCKRYFQRHFKISKRKFKIRIRNSVKGYGTNKTIELGINSVVLSREFENLIEEFLKNPNSDFIKGLFDAEGSVDLAGTITLWQKKDTKGKIITEVIQKFLKSNGIKFSIINNREFYIIEILGRYRNYGNLKRFSEIVGFSSNHKQRDMKLILNIFSRHRKIEENSIIGFFKKYNEATLRNVIEYFKIPKITAYDALNRLVRKNKILKINSYPNIYKLR
jgi:hypothetical protein